jgi:hypothetical protein
MMRKQRGRKQMVKEFTMQGADETEAAMVQFNISDLASAKKAIDYLFSQTNLVSRKAHFSEESVSAVPDAKRLAAEDYASIGNALMRHDVYSKLPKPEKLA